MGYLGSSGGSMYLTGLNETIRNLNIEIGELREGSLKGLVRSASLIRHETEHTVPKTPRDLGNLVASWFVVTAVAVHAGKAPTFIGPDASQFESEHGTAVTEKQGEAKMQSAKDRQILIMGYSANYAGFIHESLIAEHFTREGSDIKWLETHIKANKDRILEIIATNVKIKK